MPSEEIITFDPSTLETIDKAVHKFVNETINAHTIGNNGFSKVPVLWLGTERAYQIKNNKELRDKVGKLKLPLITITRTNVIRDELRGSYQSYYPVENGVAGGAVQITRTINQRKTRNIINAKINLQNTGSSTGRLIEDGEIVDNRQIVYDTITIPKPTYVTCHFEVNIRTEYQQQMNDIIPPFIIDQKNIYPIDQDGHQYELFILEDYNLSNNLATLGVDERMFTAKVNFKVLGYLVGDGINQNRPQIVKRQNAVKIIIGSEQSMLGDLNDHSPNSGVGKTMTQMQEEINDFFNRSGGATGVYGSEVTASANTASNDSGEFRKY